MSRILAGPWAGQLLADYGADVIKVERPAVGDETRHWGPPWLPDPSGKATADSAYFQSANRNKRSITVDIAKPLGQKIIHELTDQSDVLLENYKVGDLARYGLDGESVCQRNPWIIYCSISAYGQFSSRASQPGYDAMIQGAAGLMSVTGPTDREGGSPQKVGVAVADIMAGMYAVTAILAALNERNASGKGERIDVPLYDSQVAWLANQNMNFLLGGEVPGRHGTGHPNIVPYQAFPTSDGALMLAIGSDAQFRRCVACLGLKKLADDPKFRRNSARVTHRDKLVDIMSKATKKKSSAFWLEQFEQNDVPAGPINSLDTVFGEDYANERQLVRMLTNSLGTKVPTVANPVQFSRQSTDYSRAPPILGEHTDEILRDELGYTSGDILTLRESGAI